MAKLLVVDSSAEGGSRISRQLRDAGHEAVCAPSAAAAMTMLRRSPFDAVITDWLLSDSSALELAASVRRLPQGASVRILVTSDRDEPAEVARALDSGLDDYLAKRSRAEELVARVNAALRRPATMGAPLLQVGPVALDRVAHKVTVNGAQIELAPAEFRLIAHFMENRGRVLARKQLLSEVWNRRRGIGERTVDVHVRRLRAALTPHGCEHLLQTVRGFGYRFG